MRNCTV